MSEKPTTAPLRKAGLIFRITAAMFALAGIAYAIRAYRTEAAESDLSMSVLQFSLAMVFFAVSAGCYKRAESEEERLR